MTATGAASYQLAQQNGALAGDGHSRERLFEGKNESLKVDSIEPAFLKRSDTWEEPQERDKHSAQNYDVHDPAQPGYRVTNQI